MRSEAAAWIGRYAEQKLHPVELNRLVEMTDREIITEIAGYGADEELRRDLHSSTSAHWRRFLSAVTGDPFEVHPPPEAFDLARTIARRGLDLTVLLKTYRVAQRAVWAHVTETVNEQIGDGDLRSAVLVRFWDRVSRWIDDSIEVLVGTYTEEREQWQRGALARRVDAVQAILRGDEVDVDAATALLGHPLRRHHTAFVLWAEEGTPEPDVMRVLEGAATTLGALLGGPHPLSMASGARGLWCWATTPARPEPETLATPTLRAGVRAAVGIPAPGVEGFRRSHREALAAQSAAIIGRSNHVVTRYADIELACLAAGIGGMEAMYALIERELGDLAAPDKTTARLRRTLRLYLANGGNTDLTGKVLRLHRNTIRYRIHQAEQLLGHSIHERRVYLELALHCIDVYDRRD